MPDPIILGRGTALLEAVKSSEMYFPNMENLCAVLKDRFS